MHPREFKDNDLFLTKKEAFAIDDERRRLIQENEKLTGQLRKIDRELSMLKYKESESFDRTASHMAGEYVSYKAELTDEEILEVWKENEKVYPMDRSRLLDRTRACIRKAQIEVGCAECGVNDNNHALYCVACAEKFVGEAATKLQQKQETIEGLNRDYDLLFAEYQLLLKNTREEE